jgi:hypothetical protein
VSTSASDRAGRLWRMSIDWPFAEVDEEGDEGYFAWTAPEALRCGDRIVLYEGGRGNRSSFVAIGRAVTDAVRAHKGDHRHWAWVQWVPLADVRSRADVLDRTGYAHVSGSHVSVKEEEFDLWPLLVSDPAAASAAAEWSQGDGFPTTDQVPIHRLFEAKFRYRPQHEVAMYERIIDALLDEGFQEAPTALSAIVRTMRGATPTRPRADQLRYPDVWILDADGRELVIVEVKRRARHRPGSDYDPVDQVCNYVDLATALLRNSAFADLAVRPMVVAHEIEAAERRHARAVGVECRLFTKRTHEFRAV